MKYLFNVVSNSVVSLLILSAALSAFIFFAPQSPLPNGLNPFTPFEAEDPVTPITWRKMGPISRDLDQCLAALDAANVIYEKRDDFLNDEGCGIPSRVFLTAVGGTEIGPVETQCHIALRMALWERDVLRPAMQSWIDERPAKIVTQGSYNCRNIRTEDGDGTVRSQHATANAIDVKGVVTASGVEIFLENSWSTTTPEAGMMRELRDGGCNIFRATLGPDYNSLHEDHFHFDAGRFRICR